MRIAKKEFKETICCQDENGTFSSHTPMHQKYHDSIVKNPTLAPPSISMLSDVKMHCGSIGMSQISEVTDCMERRASAVLTKSYRKMKDAHTSSAKEYLMT
jgi:hypothetical protein